MPLPPNMPGDICPTENGADDAHPGDKQATEKENNMYTGDEHGLILGRILRTLKEQNRTDAELERALGLRPKTVSNWRRGVSHAYMGQLPEIAVFLGLPLSALEGTPEHEQLPADLPADERALLLRYREARCLPPKKRRALLEALDHIMTLFLQER